MIETLARTYFVWKIADVLEQNIEEIVSLESENTGKPIGVTMAEEVGPMLDQIRYFATAARNLEGKSAGEYMKGHTSMIRREPYASIGKSIGLSEAAVRQRVQKLLDSNVMQVVAVTDPLQVGFKRAAMIGVNVEGDIEKVADALAKLEEVNYVVVCAGGFDILIEVVCEDDEKLLSILNKKIRAIPGVDSTEAFVYLKIRKQTYSWGTK